MVAPILGRFLLPAAQIGKFGSTAGRGRQTRMGFNFTFSLRDVAIHRRTIDRAINKGRESVLRREAALVRRRARRLIGVPAKDKTKPRPEGKPPRARRRSGKEGGIRLILYGYDRRTKTYVVGPKLFKYQRPQATVVELHEWGRMYPVRFRVKRPGTRRKMTVRQKRAFKKKFSGKQAPRRAPPQFVTRVIKYPERPYMSQALSDMAPKFAKMWRDKIK